MHLSQLREYLAEVQDSEGDLEVRFPAMVTTDQDDYSETVSIEGTAVITEDGISRFVVICDAYTLDMMQQ